MNIEIPSVRASTEATGYHVCMAEHEHHQREVASLIGRMYSWRGYQSEPTPVATGRSGQTVFQVRNNDRLVATLTLRMDSHAGLLADQLYRDEIDVFRNVGGKLCEFTGLAIVPGEDSREVLGSLIRVAHDVSWGQHGASDAVIEVNPRHVPYYKRCLGFREAGPERVCPRVKAPAVLLHLDLDDFGERFGRGHRRELPFTRRSY